jgi:hypothetical protein
MQPKQGNGATIIHEISSSFHYLNRGTWATHVQLASFASRLESSQLLCVKPPKSPNSWPSSGLWNTNHLRPLHVDDDFLGHPNGLVPTPLHLHLPSLVCNHLAISLLVTTPPEIIPYYRLNHSIWSLSDNKEVSR